MIHKTFQVPVISDVFNYGVVFPHLPVRKFGENNVKKLERRGLLLVAARTIYYEWPMDRQNGLKLGQIIFKNDIFDPTVVGTLGL